MKRVIAIQVSAVSKDETAAFKQSVLALVKDGFQVDMITTLKNRQMLGLMDKVETIFIPYHESKNGLLRAVYFLRMQLSLFALVFKKVKPGNTVYISAVEPFAAALAAKFCNAKVIYHLQNLPMNFGMAYRSLVTVVNHTADQVIFTSANLKDRMNLSVKKQAVVYHTLTKAFINKINNKPADVSTASLSTVLMISPLKMHKGVAEFIQLVKTLPEMIFTLVITDGFQNLKNNKLLLSGK